MSLILGNVVTVLPSPPFLHRRHMVRDEVMTSFSWASSAGGKQVEVRSGQGWESDVRTCEKHKMVVGHPWDTAVWSGCRIMMAGALWMNLGGQVDNQR